MERIIVPLVDMIRRAPCMQRRIAVVARLHLATQATVCLLGMLVLFRAEVQGQVVQDVIAPLDSLSARQLAAELHRLEAILPEAPRALATTLGPRAAALLSAADLPAADRLLLVKTLAPQLDDQARAAALSAMQVVTQRSGDRLRQAVRLDQQLQVLQRQASRRQIYQRYLDKAREKADEGAIQQYEQLLDALD